MINHRPNISFIFKATLFFCLVSFFVHFPSSAGSQEPMPKREMLMFEKKEVTARCLVLKSRDIYPYDQALEGFKDELNRQGIVAECFLYNLDGSFSEGYKIIDELEFEGTDFVLCIGSLATTIAYEEVKDTPIVFTMVLDPVASGFIESKEGTLSNIVGSSLDVPFQVQFRELKKVLPRAGKVGVLFRPEETLDVIAEMKAEAKSFGLEIISREVYSEEGVPKALESIIAASDVILAIGDSTVFSPKSTEYIIKKCLDKKVPLVGLSSSFVREGALYAISPDYRDVGTQAGEIAAEIIKGRDIKDLKMADPRIFYLSINLVTAKEIGVNIPKDIIEGAKEVIK